MTTTKILLALGAALALAGCAATPEGEGLGERIADRQASYCSGTSPVARAAALAVIRSRVPEYPASGLCTDADQALADEIARQLETLPEGAVLDIEQAREDQERFRAE